MRRVSKNMFDFMDAFVSVYGQDALDLSDVHYGINDDMFIVSNNNGKYERFRLFTDGILEVQTIDGEWSVVN